MCAATASTACTLKDPKRFGLLGKGAILTMTANPNRTAPVLRGVWILERILGTPPANPPPNVPDLNSANTGGRPTTVREKTEIHRRNPQCASCHAVMDPLGFALENFDTVGPVPHRGPAVAPAHRHRRHHA